MSLYLAKIGAKYENDACISDKSSLNKSFFVLISLRHRAQFHMDKSHIAVVELYERQVAVLIAV